MTAQVYSADSAASAISLLHVGPWYYNDSKEIRCGDHDTCRSWQQLCLCSSAAMTRWRICVKQITPSTQASHRQCYNAAPAVHLQGHQLGQNIASSFTHVFTAPSCESSSQHSCAHTRCSRHRIPWQHQSQPLHHQVNKPSRHTSILPSTSVGAVANTSG